MKNIFYLSFLLILFSCHEKVFLSQEKEKVIEEEADNGPIFLVTGKVTSSSSYCGGARPSDELLNAYTASRPLKGSTFYVKKGKENDLNKKIVMTFSTADDGSFSFKLPKGDYVIIEANRLDSTYFKSVMVKYEKATDSYTAVDKKCLNEWLRGSMMQFKIVDANVSSLDWDIHHGCWTDDPCVQYTGPYPP